jgi:hypothetical protein
MWTMRESAGEEGEKRVEVKVEMRVETERRTTTTMKTMICLGSGTRIT